MKLLLSSNSEYVIKYGLKLFFKDIEEIKLAYITTASKASSVKNYIEQHKAAMRVEGYDFQAIDIEEKDKQQIEDLLKDKNMVWVEGGNTFYLLKACRESGFDKVIINLIKNNKIIYVGTSAGSYIACPTIEVSTWKKPGEEKKRFGVTDLSALNLVPFLIKAHFKEPDRELIQEKSKVTKYSVKIIKDGQAILVMDNDIKLVEGG